MSRPPIPSAQQATDFRRITDRQRLRRPKPNFERDWARRFRRARIYYEYEKWRVDFADGRGFVPDLVAHDAGRLHIIELEALKRNGAWQRLLALADLKPGIAVSLARTVRRRFETTLSRVEARKFLRRLGLNPDRWTITTYQRRHRGARR